MSCADWSVSDLYGLLGGPHQEVEEHLCALDQLQLQLPLSIHDQSEKGS